MDADRSSVAVELPSQIVGRGAFGVPGDQELDFFGLQAVLVLNNLGRINVEGGQVALC
jgi:hypothetical protein